MRVKVKTKSNFHNLNGQWLPLKEVVGTRVTVTMPFSEFGFQTIDFQLSEVVEMDTTTNVENLHPVFSNILKGF